jgi:hypothetical protein
MLNFREFIGRRSQQRSVGPTSVERALDEQAHVGPIIARARAPQNLSDPIPALLTFQRREIRQFSDGRVVGLYREVRTGVEMVFPSSM